MNKLLRGRVVVPALAAALLALAAGRAAAQAPADAPEPVDVEVPTVVLDSTVEGGTGGGPDEQLDLANVVQSAAKGVTTVQEAPAIVTVITADDLRERQFVTLDQTLDTVPGYMRNGLINGQFPMATVRGTVQAAFSSSTTRCPRCSIPFLNIPSTNRLQPIETIKRIETITGPGGVLVGRQLVPRRGQRDHQGRRGRRRHRGRRSARPRRRRPANARAYVMAGVPDLLGGRAKLFFHGAFETYEGPGFEMPLHMFSAPAAPAQRDRLATGR
jgi:hypothetical protein